MSRSERHGIFGTQVEATVDEPVTTVLLDSLGDLRVLRRVTVFELNYNVAAAARDLVVDELTRPGSFAALTR